MRARQSRSIEIGYADNTSKYVFMHYRKTERLTERERERKRKKAHPRFAADGTSLVYRRERARLSSEFKIRGTTLHYNNRIEFCFLFPIFESTGEKKKKIPDSGNGRHSCVKSQLES